MLDNRKSFLVARISAQVSSWAVSAVLNSGRFCLSACRSQHRRATRGIGSSGRVSQTLRSVSGAQTVVRGAAIASGCEHNHQLLKGERKIL